MAILDRFLVDEQLRQAADNMNKVRKAAEANRRRQRDVADVVEGTAPVTVERPNLSLRENEG